MINKVVLRSNWGIVLSLFLSLLMTSSVTLACCHYRHLHRYHHSYYRTHFTGTDVAMGLVAGAIVGAAIESASSSVYVDHRPRLYRTCVKRYDRFGLYYHCTEYYR